jgi:release factor glutamine methyltransferase
LLTAAAARLAAAGVATPRVDAELLLAHVLGVPRSRLVLAPPPDPVAVATFGAAVTRRATREPLQHIVGTAPFRTIEVAVGPGVFVPRPETELLVDAVRPAVPAGGLAIDLCSGSGALALALAAEVPRLRIIAVEADPDALLWLRRNAEGSAVTVLAADVTAGPLLPELVGSVDAVVCNPPYVPTSVGVAAEVRHDPPVAVFAGETGLAVLPHVIDRAAELLRPGGVLALEHDDTHGSAVPALLRDDGRWREIAEHHDLAGRPRYATAVRT